MANDLTLRNARVLTATGLSDPTTVAVVDGVIVRDLRPGAEEIDVAGCALLPGFDRLSRAHRL